MCSPATIVVSLILIASAIQSTPAEAGLITINTLETEYTAGQAFDFTVEMPDIISLFAYEISLHLTSNVGTAGVDYYFADASPASSNYLFAATTNFADTTVIDSPSLSRMTISDIDDVLGTDIVSGVNGQIANVQIMTAANFAGELEISVDLNGLFLDTLNLSDFSLSSVTEYDSIVNETLAADPTRISSAASTVVPEPSTAVIALIGLVGVALARRRGMARDVSPRQIRG
ncbi:hypothetical protein TBK1r_64000 [Stieleria magnilauensis]|uniref:Ice-binding protein C-terminal domain-containing protein n=2 Tax=Stieleria magnilauensis TaxID=2527963 RepID=A0ABX5Y2E6_9BACT|nr:hypothetical protein TBK1r_64000 [Planctomycetes bacterium TBK1r]